MNLKFIRSSEKKKILAELNELYGIQEIPYLLIETGKEKFRGYSGSLSKEEIQEISKITSIELIGTYLVKKERTLRISLDGTHIFSDQITKNIIEITKEQYELWIRGYDLPIQKPSGVYIIKFEEDFIGSGISNGSKILNHIPKERRLKTPLPKHE